MMKDFPDEQMNLPPGFRFHPTDEELITHYLIHKVLDDTFSAKAIGEVDMNRIEPWELPRLAKMGEKEWYFFCVRDKKYPTGLRTNRATDAGYWKATGKDKEIIRGKSLVGMKKTLVFYKGRAPKGEKTNWVIHEYRLEGKPSIQTPPKTAKNEWVICRVFHKNSGEKKVNGSGMMLANSGGNELVPAPMPPLMDSSAPFAGGRATVIKSDSVNVPCFSNPITIQTPHNNFLNNPSYPFDPSSDGNNYCFPATQSSLPAMQDNPESQFQFQFQFGSGYTFPGQDQTILKGLIEDHHGFEMDGEMVTGSQETGLSSEMNTENSSVMSNLEIGKVGFQDQEAPSTSVAPIDDMDCIWNY
ncbi:NAC domain-containing protein 100-like [Cynara cardunculus var. scolymus]|uniref:NAC domain-containing protein n=1 Tax=Cynara cardunculus var. scolymus TaxID=59895 RepID=A0A103XXQ6_CYNCS|nr:NAC domain-containing protein 100-like [Cynara cardunculus var. scolymus]KVH98868.1 hypothetical protein Ccrd_022903 [Cynara cardunculus var. scolymus]